MYTECKPAPEHFVAARAGAPGLIFSTPTPIRAVTVAEALDTIAPALDRLSNGAAETSYEQGAVEDLRFVVCQLLVELRGRRLVPASLTVHSDDSAVILARISARIAERTAGRTIALSDRASTSTLDALERLRTTGPPAQSSPSEPASSPPEPGPAATLRGRLRWRRRRRDLTSPVADPRIAHFVAFTGPASLR